MNKLTKKVAECLAHPVYDQQIIELKKKYPNYKDFYNQLGYVVMDLVNTESRFFDCDRKEIELDKISQKYF